MSEPNEIPLTPSPIMGPGRLGLSPTVFALSLLIVALASDVLTLPIYYNVEVFGFSDPGACLTVFEKVEQEQLPYRDFDYVYGLLPIAAGEFWFHLFGRTPAAFMLAVALCNGLALWAFVRFARALNVGLPGQLLILATLPLLLPNCYLSVTHAMEAPLLSHALAELARGRKSTALALATTCLFVKPGMAYFLGLILLIFIGREAYCLGKTVRPAAAFLKAILPAGLTGLFLLSSLASWMGLAYTLDSLLPLKGMQVLGQLDMGPAQMFRTFLAPPEARNLVNYYLGTSTGFLVAGALALALGALANLPWLISCASPQDLICRRAECLITCALLAFAHYFLLWNNMPEAHSYLLGLGLAALSLGGTFARLAVVGLLSLACLGYYAPVRFVYKSLSSLERNEDCASLWCRPELAKEWLQIRELTRGHSTALLARVSGYDGLFEGWRRPVNWFFDPGLVRDDQLRLQLNTMAEVEFVVLATWGINKDVLIFYPQLKGPLAKMDLVWQGPFFEVYQRKPVEPAHP